MAAAAAIVGVVWRESRYVEIDECGEPLVPIPLDRYAVVEPHPYAAAGAPYGSRSPYYLRSDVLRRLDAAQDQLHRAASLSILVYDAYRPVAVQEFMVRHTLAQVAAERGHHVEALSAERRRELLELVHRFWAVPSEDPRTPPPHSTGAAMDITLVGPDGEAMPMGGRIDELSDRSWPDHYARDSSEAGNRFHHNRQLLADAMTAQGFEQHPNEWWHFSYGDQLWAWLREQRTGQQHRAAYGGVAVG